MTTNLPRGRATLLNLKGQADFPTAASGANAVQLNVYQRTFNKKKPLEDDDINGVVGYANPTDARPAEPGLEDADGSLQAPLDLHQIGYWLLMTLGAPGSAAVDDPAPAGTYAHTFTSGAAGLPIATMEAMNAPGQFEKLIGGLVQDATLPIGPDRGYAKVPITLMGRQTSDPYNASVFTGPTVSALAKRVPNSKGIITIGGVQVARITRGTLKISNSIEMDRYAGENVQSDAFLAKISTDLNLTARYVTDAIRAYGATGSDGFLPDAQEVALTWSLGTYMKLVVTLPAVRFEPVSVPVQNGGTMTVDLKGRGEVGAAAPMVTAVLTNLTTAYAL
ncbi:phage tail tube protein [Caulobacter sp. 1776]|uniref:phage tail tube protein n=1 Tax=Caulobacter sp. 1776 TaxID=3156420 RepID=UPI0033955B14